MCLKVTRLIYYIPDRFRLQYFQILILNEKLWSDNVGHALFDPKAWEQPFDFSLFLKKCVPLMSV